MPDPNCELCKLSGDIGCVNHMRTTEETAFNDMIDDMDFDDATANAERFEQYKEDHPFRKGSGRSGLDRDEISEWGPPEW